MSRPNNPRYPHTCKILRVSATNAMTDEPDIYDQLESEAPMENVTVVYDGACRAYSKQQTSDKGEVVTSYHGLALPLTRDDWEKLGCVPLEGDLVVVNRGGYKEYGVVIDKNPANFGGTHLIWRYGRN